LMNPLSDHGGLHHFADLLVLRLVE